MFKNITAVNCEHAVSLRGKYVIVDAVSPYNCDYDLYFGNNNATNNQVMFEPKSVRFGGSNTHAWFLQNNTVKGWQRRYHYLRPAAMLLNAKGDTQSWNNNKLVSTKQTYLCTSSTPWARSLKLLMICAVICDSITLRTPLISREVPCRCRFGRCSYPGISQSGIRNLPDITVKR